MTENEDAALKRYVMQQEARQEVELGIETVTPEQAQLWLDNCNLRNRNLSQFAVNKYARDIENGNWKLVGDPIRFDWDGILRDGQHRLAAIVKVGQPVQIAVLRGMDPDDFVVIDTGKKRTQANALQMLGDEFSNAGTLAAVLQILDAYKNGQFVHANSGPSYQYTTSEVIELAYEYREYGIEKDVRAALAKAKYCPLTNSVVAAARFLQRQVADEDTVEEFWEGVNFTAAPGDARFTLREWAKKNQGRGSVSRKDVSRQLFAITMAWNAWRRGRNVRLTDNSFILEPEERNEENRVIKRTVWKPIPKFKK